MARAWPVPFIGVCHTLAYINMVVAIFNLVPAFPLDGGRILRAALWYWKDDLHTATYIPSRMGNGFGIVLMILGGIAFLQGVYVGGMWWSLVGLFLRGAAVASYQQLLFQKFLQNHPVKDFMKSDPLTVPPSISIQDWIDDYVYRHHFKMFPVVEDSNLIGCISINKIRRSDWRNKKVRDLLEPVSDANTVSADADTTMLLAKMVQPGTQARYMVVDRGQLVAMISLKDLLDLIALRLELESPGH